MDYRALAEVELALARQLADDLDEIVEKINRDFGRDPDLARDWDEVDLLARKEIELRDADLEVAAWKAAVSSGSQASWQNAVAAQAVTAGLEGLSPLTLRSGVTVALPKGSAT